MAKIEVELRGEKMTLEAEENKVLLDALLEANIKYPHGCRVGSCGACRTLILEGAENLSPGGLIEEITLSGVMATHQNQEIPKGASVRLACRGKIKGDLKLKPL